MPLSEEELRLLEQMERALVAEDPKFASTLRGTKMRQRARRHVIGGVLVFIGGIALLMSGVVLGQGTEGIILGVLGFVVMLASAYFTLNAWRGQNRSNFTGGAAAAAPNAPHLRVVPGGKSRRNRSRTPKQGTMMQRFEERWRRRREQNGGF